MKRPQWSLKKLITLSLLSFFSIAMFVLAFFSFKEVQMHNRHILELSLKNTAYDVAWILQDMPHVDWNKWHQSSLATVSAGVVNQALNQDTKSNLQANYINIQHVGIYDRDQKQWLFRSASMPAFDETCLKTGYYSCRYHDNTYKSFILLNSSATRYIAVSVKRAEFNQLILQGYLPHLWLFLGFYILFVLMVLIISHFCFKPLERLASDIEAVELEKLRGIDLPHYTIFTEIAPLVAALNALLQNASKLVAIEQGFIQDAAHQLRTPMSALRAQLELVQLHLGSKEQAYVSKMIQGVDRCCDLTAQLLNLSRAEVIEAKGASSIDIMPVLQQVIDDLLPLVHEQKMQIDYQSTLETCHWIVDQEQLYVLFYNLLSNAIKYGPGGQKITIAVDENDTQSTVSITDEGPGIEACEHKKVFERFYRPLGHKANGSGLGLAIVKTICDKYDIKISLASIAPKDSLKVILSYLIKRH